MTVKLTKNKLIALVAGDALLTAILVGIAAGTSGKVVAGLVFLALVGADLWALNRLKAMGVRVEVI